MTSHYSTELHNGVLRKVQILTYNNGLVNKRVYEKPQDVVPFDIIWASSPKPITESDVIEHREVTLLKHHFNM